MNKIVISLVLLAIFAAVIVGSVFLMKHLNKKNAKTQEADKPQKEEPEKELIPLKNFIDEVLSKDANIEMRFLTKVNLEKLFSIDVTEELKATMINNALDAIKIAYETRKPCDEYDYRSGNVWTFLSWLIYRDPKTLTDEVSEKTNIEFLYTLDSSKAEEFYKNLEVLNSYMVELTKTVSTKNVEFQNTIENNSERKSLAKFLSDCNDVCWLAAKQYIDMVLRKKTGFLTKLIDAYKDYENQ